MDAIILNAVDGDGIITALETAEEKGILVITVDMKPTSGTYETYIGSDNYLEENWQRVMQFRNFWEGRKTLKLYF